MKKNKPNSGLIFGIFCSVLLALPALLFTLMTFIFFIIHITGYDKEMLLPTIIFFVLSIFLWLASISFLIMGYKITKYKKSALDCSETISVISTSLDSSTDANSAIDSPEPEEDEDRALFFIDMMEGHDFEHYCAKLLLKNGFSEATVTPGSGDQGVDILAVKDSIRYAVQCKNFATPLSNKPIQEVHAGKAFYNCHVGVVMTNSTFTPGAIALAQATGTLLWDRTELQKMMNNANLN